MLQKEQQPFDLAPVEEDLPAIQVNKTMGGDSDYQSSINDRKDLSHDTKDLSNILSVDIDKECEKEMNANANDYGFVNDFNAMKQSGQYKPPVKSIAKLNPAMNSVTNVYKDEDQELQSLALGESATKEPIAEPVIWDKFSDLNNTNEMECEDDYDDGEDDPYSDDFGELSNDDKKEVK